jgi:AcrR family transcriptional regulator
MGKALPNRLTSAERRVQIIETATHLFSELGFDRVTVKLLAGRCGVTEAALYRHFESKDQLYDAVLTDLKSRVDIEGRLKELTDCQNIDELLFGLARHILSVYSNNTELSRLLLMSALSNHPLAKRVFQDLRVPYVKFLTHKLSEMSRRGHIRKIQPEIGARCFIGMVIDCSLSMHLWREMQGKSYKPEEVINNNVPVFAAGLRSGAPQGRAQGGKTA